MKILFDKIGLLFENGDVKSDWYLTVEDDKITYIGGEKPEGSFDRVINGKEKVLCPGFYNCHTHAPMTLFRGYAEDLPLDRWLNEKIFPAEDRLYPGAVRAAAMLSIAEMIKCGTVSFSDMYFFCDQIAEAVAETGIKANISRSVSEFNPDIKKEDDRRYQESVALFKKYHNTENGRIKIDMSLHSEYTTVSAVCRYLSDFAYENGTGMQLHLSETIKEHNNCIKKYGMTPAEHFEETGVFRVPVTAAHCVYLSDHDMEIMKKYGATAVHNPVSNLKLGSGVMPLAKIRDAGINVALGTDGPASNNTVDIMKEAFIAAILQKGISGKTDEMQSREFITMLTENGAKAQCRTDCGKMKVGYKADLVMLNFDEIHTLPVYNYCDGFLYSATSSNVVMTMVDGNILYENGEFKTMDIEKVKNDFKSVIKTYFQD